MAATAFDQLAARSERIMNQAVVGHPVKVYPARRLSTTSPVEPCPAGRAGNVALLHLEVGLSCGTRQSAAPVLHGSTAST